MIPAGQGFGDLLPLAAMPAMRIKQHLIVPTGPFPFIDVGIKMVMPSTLEMPYRSLHCLPVRSL